MEKYFLNCDPPICVLPAEEGFANLGFKLFLCGLSRNDSEDLLRNTRKSEEIDATLMAEKTSLFGEESFLPPSCLKFSFHVFRVFRGHFLLHGYSVLRGLCDLGVKCRSLRRLVLATKSRKKKEWGRQR